MTPKKHKTRPLTLVADIGNTSTSLALYRETTRQRVWTDENSSIPKIIAEIAKSGSKTINKAIISTVVPKKALILRKLVAQKIGCPTYEIKRQIKLKIKSNYIDINKLGSDRLVNLWGAIQKYPCPLVVIDFGTAVTFDVLSARGVFLGGLILPGLQTALDALHEKTALLPWIDFKPPKRFLGTNTQSGMQGGLFWGWSSMIQGLIKQTESNTGHLKTVILTGGMSPLFKAQIHHPNVRILPYHTLDSLNELSAQSCRK
jgi:type III pantothenate kinase